MMASNGAITAANRSVPDVLTLLDSSFSDFADGVAEAKYAFWIGSGISINRLPNLATIVDRVMIYLYENANFADNSCKFRAALGEALALASLSEDDFAAIDYMQHFSIWPQHTTIVTNLTKNYSRLLDIRLSGFKDDFLLWDVVDVRATFADDSTVVDCEHLAIAVLVLEGALNEMVSANWDGLIEKALHELAPTASTVNICVLDVDTRVGRTARARLYKFHGCAVLAKKDEATYRSRLVGRSSQITGWVDEPTNAAMKATLTSIAAQFPTFMVGMSAQDADIQAIFSAARLLIKWPWPSKPPAHIFSGESLGEMQNNILKMVYAEAYRDSQQAITSDTLFPAYAKGALTSLVLAVLERKLRTLIRHSTSPTIISLSGGTGITHLRDKLASAIGSSHLRFLQEFIKSSRSLLMMFRLGIFPDSQDNSYQALTSTPASKAVVDANFSTTGLPELAYALELLGRGDESGHWTVEASDTANAQSGALRMHTPIGVTAVYFVVNDAVALRLETDNVVPLDRSDSLLIFSAAGRPPQTRSPRSRRRTGKRIGRRMIDMRALLAEAKNLDELQIRFQEEAVL